MYRLRAWPDTFESRCAALCAADPTIVIGCGSSCRLHGVRRCTGNTIHVLTTRGAWRRPVDSHPELVLLDALRRAGLELATQPSPKLPDGRTIHPDLGDDDIRFYIEVDDHTWHGGRARTTRDNIRDRQAELGGAEVVRVGTDEIEVRLDALVNEIGELHRMRHRQILGSTAA